MCGIAGGIGVGMEQYLRTNIKLLRNRGPDSQGILSIDNNLILAATRLAMTDPNPRSNQPMQDHCSKNSIVFNGEIYNFRDLRKKLLLSQIRFNTESDTEVILKSLQNNGNQVIKNFEGMFAFVYHNYQEDKLVLARDYLGKKPLFYSISSEYLIFSSQINVIKGFLKKASLDFESVTTFLKLGYIVSPKTMYQEINSVHPGEIIEIDLKKLTLVSKSYFTPDSITNPINLGSREILGSAVKERVTGHDRVALSMSGGIDSTIIAIEASNLGLDCEAYTMQWSDSDKSVYNLDVDAAQKITKKLGLKFKPVEMPNLKNLGEQIDKYVLAMGEPNSNPNGISMMALYSQISSDGHRLALTGDGADEIFGGYSRYSIIRKLGKIPNFDNKFLYKLLESNRFTNKPFKYLSLTGIDMNSWEFWLYWQELSTNNYLRNNFKNYKFQEFLNYNDWLNEFTTSERNRVASIMYKDLKMWLSMESNVKLDRISMNFSIEARSPFQSEKLIGSAFRELSDSNFQLLNKKILTQNYSELLSLPILHTKKGFLSPLGHWLRGSDNLIQERLEYLSDFLPFEKVELKKLSMSPSKGVYKDFRFLWSLLILASWHHSESR